MLPPSKCSTIIKNAPTRPPRHLILSEGATKSIEVDCVTLEDIFENRGLDKVDLLKLNFEGSELGIIFAIARISHCGGWKGYAMGLEIGRHAKGFHMYQG